MEKFEEMAARLRAMSLEAVNAGVLWENWMKLLKHEASWAEFEDHTQATLDNRLEGWMLHFRDNLYAHILDKPRIESLKEYVKERMGIFDRALCIGGGTSIKNADLKMLRKYDGLVICCDKPFKRALNYITPQIVLSMHGTDETLGHFDLPSVREAMKERHILMALSTHMDPKVTKVITESAPPEHIWWFNSSVPMSHAANIDVMQRLMSFDLPTFDTGGNVGIGSLILAKDVLGIKEVAMLGMEHCVDIEWNWTKEQAQQHNLVIDLENKEVIAIPAVFRGYLLSLVDFISRAKADGVKVVNLTSKGTFFINREELNVPYVPLKDYV